MYPHKTQANFVCSHMIVYTKAGYKSNSLVDIGDLMAYKQQRRIVRFGSASRGITLPKGWLEFYGLKERDPVIVLGGCILIVARPEDARHAEEVMATLEKPSNACSDK